MSLFAEIIFSPALDGMHLFPLNPGTKVPATTHGQDDATNDLATLSQWTTRYPKANAGIHCAQSGLYVVDVDSGEGKEGATSWDALIAQHGHVDTLTVRTQSGGLHFYYRMPPGDILTNTAGKLGKNIDTRGNGYVVAPGSIVNGRPYEIVNDVPVAELPQWIADAIRKPKPKPKPAAAALAAPVEYAPAADVTERVRQLADELAHAPEGEGNHAAARIAFMVGGYVGAGQISIHEAQSTLESALAGWTFRDTQSERAMYSTISRQLTEGAGNPRPWKAATFPSTIGDSIPVPADPLADGYARHAEVELSPGSLLTGMDDGESNPKPKPTDWNTDAGQARWIRDATQNLIYVDGVGWLRYDGKRWEPISEAQVGKAIVAFYKAEFDKALKKWQKKPDDDAVHKRCQFLAKQQGAFRVTAVMKALKWVSSLDGSEPANRLDADHHLLNTPAGIVDLRTGALLEHDPKYLITRITSGNYRPGYRHPDWTEKVADCLPAVAWEYLQLRIGASIVSDSHPDTMIFLYGPKGRNGKSSIGDDGVLPAIGDYGHLAPAHVLAGGGGKDGALSPDKAELRGRRFVLIEELEEGAAFSSNEAKRLIGTGSVSARTLHEKPMTFNASHTLFATTNHEPNVPETTEAAWRRLLMIRFEKEYVLNPTEPHQVLGDPGLKGRLRTNESGQHDAIVTWLVEGAMRYYADPTAILKDREPAIVAEWTATWRAKADRVFAYFADRLEYDPDAAVATVDLFEDVNNWLTGNGYTKWSRKTFLDRMLSHAKLDGKVRRSKTTRVHALSRPETDYPAKLGNQPEVLVGVRFQLDDTAPAACVCPNAAHGFHSRDCAKSAA